MSRPSISALLCTALFLHPVFLPAQDSASSSHAALGFLEGTWVADGDSVDLGRYAEEIRAGWRHDGRFLFLEYRMSAADGRVLADETLIFGRDAVMGKQVSFQFHSDGTISRGLEAPGGGKGIWVWEGNRYGPKRNERFRLTLARVHDDAFILNTDVRGDDAAAWQGYSVSRFRRVPDGTAGARVPGARPVSDDPGSRRPSGREPRPGRHVRIQVERFLVETQDTEAFDLAFRYRNAGLDVSAGSLGGPNGLVVFGADEHFAAALRTQRTRGRTRESSQSFLLVMEGGEAMLETLQVQPVARTVLVPVYRGAVVVRTIQEEVTGSGFRVRIDRADHDGVDLELAPYFHRARRGETLVVGELATRLRLLPGRPYTILAERGGQTSVASALLSTRRADRGYESIHVLTVFVEGE